MNNILFLHDAQSEGSRVIDYLRLSGYYVAEKDLQFVDKYESVFNQSDLILLEGEQLQICYATIQKIRRWIQIPIVLISACDDEWEKIRFFQAGLDDYVVKPYWQGELLARIQSHIERYSRLTRPFGIIEVEEITVNAFTRKVYVKGEEIDLRSKEFDVLLYLIQNMNQVVSKEDIYKAVWKDELAHGFYNSVAVHVKRVRAKIEENIDSPKYIETVWGIGYRFRGGDTE